MADSPELITSGNLLLNQLDKLAKRSQENLPQLVYTQNQVAMAARQQRNMNRMEHMADHEYGKCNPGYEPLPKEAEDMSSTINSGIFLDSKALNALNAGNKPVTQNPWLWLLGMLLTLATVGLLSYLLWRHFAATIPPATPHSVYDIIALPGEPPTEVVP